jgi:hypothetical protein
MRISLSDSSTRNGCAATSPARVLPSTAAAAALNDTRKEKALCTQGAGGTV